MSQRTAIEWTDATWNPVRGCSRVSEGCRNCYAEKIAARFINVKNMAGEIVGPGPFRGFATHRGWSGKVELIESKVTEPLRWRKPRRIFVNSMSDLFHEALPNDAVIEIFSVMALAGWHTFQVLTKRSARALNLLGDPLFWECVEGRQAELSRRGGGVPIGIDKPPSNIWLGVSVEDQKTADERIPLLLQTPAAVRFVSYEPALGPVDFSAVIMPDGDHLNTLFNDGEDAGVDWVIAGGESGPGARPPHPNWFRSVRDQCRAAGVAFLFKQWGEWAPQSRINDFAPGQVKDGVRYSDGVDMVRVGKKAAGRLLDGREWNEFPEVLA